MATKEHTTIILANLGSPTEPTAAGVREFLRQFLSDPRVVELPRLLWMFILYGFVLTFRPARVAKLYQKIWTKDGSPLVAYMASLGRKLQYTLNEKYPESLTDVRVAMTYGDNNFNTILADVARKKMERIVIVPMYPQFSAATTGSIYDCYADLIKKSRDIPDCRIIKDYFKEEIYLDALASSVNEFWCQKESRNRLLFSFHGLPQKNSDKGDPYEKQCLFTSQQVATRLNLDDNNWGIAFQSRFGPAKWLEPATDKTLESWAEAGVKDVDVICPSFSVDCLETLEEISITNRELFINAGGKTFRYIPCLNDSQKQIEIILELLKKEI